MKLNRKLSLLIGGSLLICGSTALATSGIHFNEFKKGASVKLMIPNVSPDSTEASINKFNRASLLDSRKAIAREFSQNWTTVAGDTAGFVNLPKAEKGALLHVLKTNIQPERFVKGKLVLKSTSPADLLMNGKSVARKESADSAAVAAEAPVSLEPEVNVDLQINILSSCDDPTDPEVSLEFIPDEGFDKVTVNLGSHLKERFSIETIHIGRRLTTTSISPDGKYIISRYNEFIDPDNQRSWAQLAELATGKVIDASFGIDLDWFPKGSSLMQFDKIKDSYDLYRINPADNRRTLFARDVPSSSLMIAPDESYAVYYDEKKGTAQSGIMRRVLNPDDRIPGNRDRQYMMKYDFSTGASQPLNASGESANIFGISPDSKKILYCTTRFRAEEFPFYFTDLIEMDATTLKADTILHNAGSFSGAQYSPDGKKLLVFAGPSAFDGIGLNAGNHEIANDYDTQAFILDLATRDVRAMTRDFDPALTGVAVWNAADNNIYFTAKEGFYTPLYSMNPSSGKISKLDIPLDNIRNFSMGEDNPRWISAVGMGYDYAGVGYVYNTSTAKAKVLDDPYGDHMRSLNIGKTEDWSFTASDGTVIDGTVTLPPDFDPSKKYPLIVYYYGGTTPSDRTMHHPYTPQLFASRDYVVYVINPSGTIGYGQEFSARHVNAWGKRTADDIIEGVKEFCKTHPYVNDKKIGCLGASYGGFMTQYLQTQTDIFAAAVSHAGISNVTSYWGEGFWGYSYNSVAAAKSYPWSDPDLFTKQGSLFNADKIHTPLLLLHGTVDTNVPIGESIQLFNALRILGRDVELITVEGANHVVTDYDKRKLWHATIMAWFAKYLQDDPLWWNSLYGN